MAAPKPKPAHLKLIEGRGHGTDSGGRKVKPPPAFKRLPPDAPEWLPDEARAEWERVVPELARLDLIKPVDRAALTSYVLTWQRLVDAQKLAVTYSKFEVMTLVDGEISTREVQGYGLLSQNSQGVTRAPWIAIAEAASKELRSWASEFGFTPAAESKLKAQEAGDDEGDIFAG